MNSNLEQNINTQIAQDQATINNIQKQINVTINDGFLGKLFGSLADADHYAASNFMTILHRMIENGNPSSDWKYKINLDGDKFRVLEEPITPEATQGLEKRIETKIIIPEEYRNQFKNINDLVVYGRNKQIPIRLELKEFKNYAGGHLLDHIESKFEGNLMLEIPPEPFPRINFAMKLGDMTTDIQLQIKEVIDDTRIRIANAEDNKIIDLELILNFEANAIENITIKVPQEKQGNVESHLIWAEVFFAARKGSKLEFYIDQNVALSGIITTDTENVTPEDINLFRALKRIETEFGIILVLPESIGKEEMSLISELIQIIENGEVTGSIKDPLAFTLSSIEGLDEIIKVDREGKNSQFVCTVKNKIYILFNQEINVGDEITVYPPMRLADCERLKQKMELFSEGEQLIVSYIPSQEQFISIFTNYSVVNPRNYIKSEICLEAVFGN
ncbi:MAG: hypothetical protein ACYC2T_15735 [Bacillota bacterium]